MRHVRWTSSIIVLLLLVLFITPAAPVQADIAPFDPPNGATIFPNGEQTQVRMVSETVLIDVDAVATRPTGSAKVTADFQMRNLGDTSEQVDVRFPLTFNSWAGEKCIHNYFYPPIDDLTASVDGVARAVKTISEVADVEPLFGKLSQLETPCWASFLVEFPPQKDVRIQVKYTAAGYPEERTISGQTSTSYLSFPYILGTGAGWKDTIGKADIIERLPMPANDNTVSFAFKSEDISGNEIRWHFEEFEPDGYVKAIVMNPQLWKRIQDGTNNVSQNPADGEAWGRLGKSYKEAVIYQKGFRGDDAGRQMYEQSLAAYQMAVNSLPDDPDWHYGYAEIVCQNVIWDQFPDPEGQPSAKYRCIEQLKRVFDLEPGILEKLHLSEDEPIAEEKLSHLKIIIEGLAYGYSQFGLIQIDGDQLIFIALTPVPTSIPSSATQPTYTPTIDPYPTFPPLILPTPTPTAVVIRTRIVRSTATWTHIPTATFPRATPTKTDLPTQIAEQAPSVLNQGMAALAGLLVLMAIFLSWYVLKKR
jgi:hypothetical protein